jgi:hypothetical protein
VIAPPRVYEETVKEPKSTTHLAASATRIEKLFINSTVRIEEPDFTDHQVSDIVDRVRECIAKKSGKATHLVERGDLQMVALVVAHCKRSDSVELIFRDKILKNCLESVLSALGISGVSMTDSSTLVEQLLVQ